MAPINEQPVLDELALLAGIPTDADALRPTAAERRVIQNWMNSLHKPSWLLLIAKVQAFYDQNRVQRHALASEWVEEGATVALPRFDASHDSEHVMRVTSTAMLVAVREMQRTGEAIDLDVVALAALGHDLVSSVKTDPAKKRDTQHSADLFLRLPQLVGMSWEGLLLGRSPHSIEQILTLTVEIITGCSATHGEMPTRGESKAVRDADLLECIGIIGLLRFTSSSDDLPRRIVRTLGPIPALVAGVEAWDYSVDGFIQRGLAYVDRLTTPSGRAIALARIQPAMHALAALRRELEPLADVADVLGFTGRTLKSRS